MKKILNLCLCIGLLLVISGCSKEEAKGISYDEAEILEKGEAVIKEMNAEDYQAVIDRGDETLKKALTVDQLKAGMDTYVKPLGSFQEHEQHETAQQDEHIVVGFISAYEKGKIQYVMTFNEAGAMTGIRLAPAS